MTVSQLAKLRAQFIQEKRKALSSAVTAIEKKLYNSIFDKLIAQLDIADGKIVSNDKNINLTAALDKIIREFTNNDYLKVIKLFADDLLLSQRLNKRYFEVIETDQKRLKKVTQDVNVIMRKRIGLTDKGGIVKGGYLDRISTDVTLKKEIKKAMYKAVTTGASKKDFEAKMKVLIEGNESVNGGVQKHFNRFVYDTYQQFDRSTQKLYSTKLDLQAFIYSGTKITTSRCFCIKRKGKVFTLDEAATWARDLNKSCGPIWNEDEDGKYNPVDMMGGYGCVDVPNFISNRMAVRMRPELASQLG